ncbi:MAG: alkyl sulfatase dimerization domain-containing protein [Acidimicrobiia bacterium]
MTAIEAAVDRLIDERPGKELMYFRWDDDAVPVADAIYRSGGTTASYMVVTDGGRLIVNTGMGYEAPHHRRLFDAICPGPTPYIVTTQAHVDHVGGVARFREPETRYVAQANNQACQHDDERIQGFRMATARIWFDLDAVAEWVGRENPGVPLTQDRPVPDITFDERLGLRVGELDVELVAMPGGETIDSCAVWLPQRRTALVSNLLGPLFPHFPNLNTLRGDKYRFVEPYLANVHRLRELRPEVLITGRHLPIEGADLIDASLARLHGAVDYVHTETLRGMNDGGDLPTLMREIRLPPVLRVGQGYGKVSWAVRTIWESYAGWFRLRSTTELYPVAPVEAAAELVELAGASATVERGRAKLAAGAPVVALHLAEAVLAADPSNREAMAIMVDAHDALLAAGGDASFWEDGWLRHQRDRWRAALESTGRKDGTG